MGRIYTASIQTVAITAVMDLIEIVPSSSRAILIHEIGLGQVSDLGDAEEELLLLSLAVGNTTPGSGGNTRTPIPRLFGDVASTTTVDLGNTTQASGGTTQSLNVWSWNIRIPFQVVWTPETRIFLPPSRRMVLYVVSSPNDVIDSNAYIVFEEIG